MRKRKKESLAHGDRVKAMAPFQRKDQLLYALALGPYDYLQLQEDACKDVYAKGADRTVLENAKKV